MIVREVALSAIGFADETFRISEDLGLERMISSLRAVGQAHPVLLLQRATSEPSVIVCGFRRLHGLRALGQEGAFARILNAAEFTTLEVFLRAIWDNLAQRPFNPLEAARVLFTLRQKCGVKDQALIEQFLPMLGLSPHRNVLQSYLGLHQLHAELRRLVNEGARGAGMEQHPFDRQPAAGIAGPGGRSCRDIRHDAVRNPRRS
jgi:hypothetical protein